VRKRKTRNEQARLDMVRFDADMDSEACLPAVRADLASGRARGVIRTPAFVVDGTLVEYSRGLRGLYEATQAAISVWS
jgi:predicted DsbA family dithiol-disulfide isomerase